MTLIAPFFVFEQSYCLLVFETLEELETYLEAIDVEDGVYQGFDSQGNCLKFGIIIKEDVFWGFKTFIKSVKVLDSCFAHQDVLLKKLQDFYFHCTQKNDDLTLKQLQQKVIDLCGHTR